MIFRFLVDGGVLMIPIFVLSVISLAIILERLFFWLRWRWVRDPKLRGELLHLYIDRERARQARDPVARAFFAMLRSPDDPAVAVAIAEQSLRTTRAHLPILHMIATVATSLGLLGTVVGVAVSFKSIELNNAAALVAGLSIALNTTIAGLTVSVIAYVAATLFGIKSARLGHEVEDGLNHLRAEIQRRRRRKNADGTDSP